MPLVIGKSLSASFVADLQEDYELYGEGIFALMRERFPTKYFDALVFLAKVHRIELGPPGSFARPATTAEALDRLEQRAGPQARAMLEQFLEQVKEVEAKYREEQSPIDLGGRRGPHYSPPGPSRKRSVSPGLASCTPNAGASVKPRCRHSGLTGLLLTRAKHWGEY